MVIIDGAGLRILPMGRGALLVEVADAASLTDERAVRSALGLAAALADPPHGVLEMVPAARTVLVRFDSRILTSNQAHEWIARAAAAPHAPERAREAPVVVLDVAYDGDDLAETANVLGLSVDALVARHSGAEWTVAFTGFAPGFGYLVSDQWSFDVPRLDAPRTRVPAGSVALASGFSGVYPRATPGGWRLIGTTAATLFDPDEDPPALLAPGATVRFVAVRPGVRGHSSGSGHSRGPNVPLPPSGVTGPSPTNTTFAMEVLTPGPLTTIQDLGRPAMAALGIACSGALDRDALRIANRLVGNAEDAAGLEITMGGFRARATRNVWVAATGAMAPLHVGGNAADPGTAHHWRAGEELAFDAPAHGVRTYLAIRGGIDAPLVAGSRSSDLMSGLGPRPLEAGSILSIGSTISGPIPVIEFPPWGESRDDELVVALEPGARSDWFTPEALARLYDEVWTVSVEVNRSGIRLDGPELARSTAGELPSEGMVVGAIQVPPSGRPTILLADGPVTGGYPVIAVVADASLDALAHARPGTKVRFRHSVAR